MACRCEKCGAPVDCGDRFCFDCECETEKYNAETVEEKINKKKGAKKMCISGHCNYTWGQQNYE